MSARCTVCSSLNRQAIDRAIIAGAASLRALARQHGVSLTALLRHRERHISADLLDRAPAASPSSGPSPSPGSVSSRASAPTGAPSSPEILQRVALEPEGEAFDPTIEKLRKVLVMSAMNLSQAQMGQELQCSPRTVRRYLAEARRAKIQVVTRNTAEDWFASAMFHSSFVRSELLRVLLNAKTANDETLTVKALSQLRQHARDEVLILGRLGVLDQLATPQSAIEQEEEPGEAQARALREMIEDMVRAARGEPSPDPEPAAAPTPPPTDTEDDPDLF